jgi:tRNA dimethylallyltransferase
MAKRRSHPVIPIVIIAGPTAVGKTAIALQLAGCMQGEIVGADSRQIYCAMNIGTAKPTPEELDRIPHHLIDIRQPDEVYSAADFARDASARIHEMADRGTLPFVVGGTGLYIHALLYGLFEGPGKDAEFRTGMRALADIHGKAFLHQELQRVDPPSAERLHPNDTLRIIRALEVFHLTGTPISEHQALYTKPLGEFESCLLVLNAPRPILYERIDERVERMVADGLFQEVEHLRQQSYHRELSSMSSVGYKEVLDFFDGKHDRDTTVSLIKRNTRRYAKRQLTWFKKYQDACWIEYDPSEGFDGMYDRCLQKILAWKNTVKRDT